MYDILNEDFNEKNFIPTSTQPVVRIEGMDGSDDSDNDGSDDSDLYYEFNSDSEQMDIESHTTRSTVDIKVRRPLIEDITPVEESTKKTLNIKKKKNKKRQRKH